MIKGLRTAVSRKKRRLVDEANGFDLDLSCACLDIRTFSELLCFCSVPLTILLVYLY